MIKKNTKVIFQDGENKREEDMIGGIPLSKGEIIKVHHGETIIDYEIIEKNIEVFLDGKEQTVDITYVVSKK
jgi:hypothetical protein